MNDIQFISVDGAPVFAVVPIEFWKHLRSLAGAPEILEVTPYEVRNALLTGDHPLKAWRSFRRLTLKELSKAAGVSSPYLTLIETGRRPESLKVFDRLERALDAPPGALVASPKPEAYRRN